ncbi:glycosyltransferase [Kineococcus sp. TBRC 1896]|uniref:Glycosyltransferase n=1 Tax=Kineococcus mangrovi TaxID=1660183 RepID=A0ABV4HWX3_9ACTN
MNAADTVTATREHEPPREQFDGAKLVRGARWLTAATLVIGLVNYVYSLGLTHLLPMAAFAVFGAGQALLLNAGTVASTSISWILAQGLLKARSEHERRQAVWFSILTNTALGLLAGLAVLVVALQFSDLLTATVLALVTLLIFSAATTAGYLQGDARLGTLGGLRVGDALAKLAVGFGLVAAGAGALGGLAGFGAGAVLVVVVGVLVARRDIRPVRGVLRLRRLWAPAVGVAALQGLMSLMTSLDLVLATVLSSDAAAASSYQAAMILARVPLFLAGAVAASAYPLLVGDEAAARTTMLRALRMYAVLVVPYAAALATAPAALLSLVFPSEYSEELGTLLPATAAAGVGIGAVSLVVAWFQARSAYGRGVRAQVVGMVLHVTSMLVGFSWGGVRGLAIGTALGAALVLVALTVAAGPLRPALRAPVGVLAASLLFAAVLSTLRANPVLWLALALPVGIASAVLGFRRGGEPAADRAGRSDYRARHSMIAPRRSVEGAFPTYRGRHSPPGADTAEDHEENRRMRILHLAFEDWRKPGSGGGAVRTREVDERLALRHDVTVLVSNYRGACERYENGVRWIPVGLPLGYWGGIVTYFLALPRALRRLEADLVVEDFGAPIGSIVPQLWTRRPIVAVVQWLNAEEKAKQYHLPFHWLQRAGVHRHETLVAMSHDLGERICRGNPRAQVVVIPNGVPREAFEVSAPRGDDVVFLGRLETEQKGLDLLLDAFVTAADRLPGRLLIAGEGPNRHALEKHIARLGLRDRMELVGRVEGDEKLRLLAGARLVAMPSRFETFGLVAAEAQACGTPVVAFEIPSLREVVVPGTGVLVPAFDTAAFAEAMVTVAHDPARLEEMGRKGRDHARRYDWDDVAARQELVYRGVLEAGGTRVR